MKPWYETLFENYANSYDKEEFTRGTIGEVNFIEQEIEHDKSKTILDVGCGTGRHAIELARRGYSVTGIDLSESQLKRAKEKAVEAGVSVQFPKKDARNFNFNPPFDLVVMICEGAFSLMETDQMNFDILQNVKNSLKPGGKFIFTCLNALFPLYHSVKDLVNSGSGASTTENIFDIKSFREKAEITFRDDRGESKTVESNERFYAPSEISWLLTSLNFKKIDIFGCQLGNFSREKKLTTEDFEMLVTAEK